MDKESRGALGNSAENQKVRNLLTWTALIIQMIFYAGTWTIPKFYGVTEKYNSLIIFISLAIVFFANIDILKELREGPKKNPVFYAMGAAIVIAFANLFIIGSNKGCILILANFLLIWYLAPKVDFSGKQLKTLEIFFLIMYISWFLYDRGFSYNTNTGATVTVFTLLGAMTALIRLTEKKEIYGFFAVLAVFRAITLVLWHLARGAFIALTLFLIFYFIIPRSFWKNKILYRILCVFVTLGSIAFVAFYVILGSTGFNFKLPFFYKNIFSGREQIWLEVWDILKENILTGIGSGRELKSFVEYNIHNSMYDILAVHGVIVFILSLVVIVSRLFKMQAELDKADVIKLCAASAVFAIFIESFIDMDLMWADYSPLLLFLLAEVHRRNKVKAGN